MLIMPRDLKLFEILSAFGYLNTSQVSKLFNMNIKVCQRRLRKLCNAGYLKKSLLPSVKAGKAPYLFYLGIQAGKLLDVKTYSPRFNYFLSHQLRNSDIMIDIFLYFKELPIDCKLLPEHLIRISNKNESVIPDGVFMLDKENRKALFILENCSGTEAIKNQRFNQDIETKLIKYVSIFENNNICFYDDFFENQFNRFRLLFIANNEKRFQKISELIKHYDQNGFIYLTTMERFKKNDIFGNIWDVPTLIKSNLSIIGG